MKLLISAAILGLLSLVAGFWFYTRMDTPLSCVTLSPRIVAFGDSLVSGYGAPEGKDAVTVLATLLGVPVINEGVSGDSTESALTRISTVLAHDPDIALVVLGGNDALQRVAVADTEKNLNRILGSLKDAGVRPILVGVIGGFPNDPFAPMYRRLADAHEVPLVPNILAGLIGNDTLMSDSIHPNALGYARMAERLAPAVEAVCANR